ncbi:MAG: DUF4250 domain-containing protein [Bacillota bacterium]|nr:DUF4250 domain-containing protein [Bacillota bacterium]
MDKDTVLTMDPFMLLSIVNMKLRDAYSSLQSLCDDWDIEECLLHNRLKDIGYSYDKSHNQYIPEIT